MRDVAIMVAQARNFRSKQHWDQVAERIDLKGHLLMLSMERICQKGVLYELWCMK